MRIRLFAMCSMGSLLFSRVEQIQTFNVLKNNGYNLEHSFGHGKQNLSTILVSLNLLALIASKD